MTAVLKSNTFTERAIGKVRFSNLTYLPRSNSEVRIAVISDVHLGHGRVHATEIVKVLDNIFQDERMQHLSYIVITGDLFDKRLTYDSEDVHVITRWVKRFLRSCKKHRVAIRVLEGTPSHDSRQSRWLELLNELSEIYADVRYYDKLCIDRLYDNGPIVLYVPDEVNHDASKTWLQVNELLREYGVDQVDFAFMHGMFTFQEPIRTVVSHCVDRYHSIVKHLIVIGHHHTHATHGKIVVPGSLDRLRHNEEEDKGHYQFSFDGGKVFDERFIVNDEATIFTTIDVEGLSYPLAVDKLEAYRNYPQGSHLRLRLSRDDDTYPSLREIKNLFPQFHITTKIVEAESYSPESGELIDRPAITAIRPDTIANLLRSKVIDAPAEVMAEIERILEAC